MKNIVFVLISIFMPFWAISQETDSIYMNANYENDVYYSLENGMVKIEPRANWDIAFQSDAFSSAILINDGNGAVLKTYPNGDTANWASLDTTGYSQWPEMYNHENDWMVSAFERNALGHPDYGWGVYDMTTHNVTGDSLFVLKLGNGSYKKVWIEIKLSAQNTYHFRYADLDGSNEQVVKLDVSPYENKNFIYYSITDNEIRDREPAKDTWDLLFTRYIAMIDGVFPYNVTGVLNNFNTGIAEYAPVSPDFEEWSMSDLDTARSIIGYDWKSFDMGTFTYLVDDSVTYYVSGTEGSVYRLKFTGFEGSSTGKVVFEKAMASTTGVNEYDQNNTFVSVYPNPVSDVLNINASEEISEIRLYNSSGQLVYTGSNTAETMQISVSTFRKGLYILQLDSKKGTITKKVSVK